MTQHARLESLLSKLTAPPQDLSLLSFCNGSKESQVNTWIQSLPLTQAQYVSGLFYSALPEISRLKTTPETRLSILELFREPVFQCLLGLSPRFLNQPLILPEAALKTATIAQAIQKHQLNGYLAVVQELCSPTRTPKKEDGDLQALAIERTLTSLGQLLLRSYQLYIPVSGQLWTEAHTLYQLAQTLGIEHHLVEDTLPHHHHARSVYWSYIRVLLLASARPNQLRQDEVVAAYNALDYLAQFADLDTYNSSGQDNLFVIATDSNRAPFYKSHANNGKMSTTIGNLVGSSLLELRTSQLVSKVQEYQALGAEASTKENSLRNELNMSAALTQHVIQSWSHLAMRSFDRQDVNNADIEITIGLTNIHFHIANHQPFNIFLNQLTTASGSNKNAIFQKHGVVLKNTAPKKEDDPWGDTFDIKGTMFDGEAKSTSAIEKDLRQRELEHYHLQHPIYSVPMVDRSPGGYGLEWRDEIPVQMKAGELIGLREYGSTRWSIGVVRWAHQLKGATQLGIQVIAPQAQPIALAAIQKTGEYAEYLRALKIPELRAINQPASVITNAISFHEYNKARLYSQPPEGTAYAGDKTIQLTRRLFATGAFSQFSFRDLVTAKPQETDTKDDFDSVWEQ